MEKILDSSVRKELYESLINGGFEKEEATSIIFRKYGPILRSHLIDAIDKLLSDIKECNYNDALGLFSTINIYLGVKGIDTAIKELSRIDDILSKEKGEKKEEMPLEDASKISVKKDN